MLHDRSDPFTILAYEWKKKQQNIKIWLEEMKITLKFQYIYVAGER